MASKHIVSRAQQNPFAGQAIERCLHRCLVEEPFLHGRLLKRHCAHAVKDLILITRTKSCPALDKPLLGSYKEWLRPVIITAAARQGRNFTVAAVYQLWRKHVRFTSPLCKSCAEESLLSSGAKNVHPRSPVFPLPCARKRQSSQIRPDHARSGHVSPDQGRSSQISPDQARSTQIKIDHCRSSQIWLDQPRSCQISLDHARLAQIRPDLAGSTQIRPDQARSTQIKPDQAR